MLLFISPKNEVDRYSERVCKNTLENCIFINFFHSPSNGKDLTIDNTSKNPHLILSIHVQNIFIFKQMRIFSLLVFYLYLFLFHINKVIC